MRVRHIAAFLASGLLGACLDQLDETSIEQAVTNGEDLVTSAVGDPPASAAIGTDFAVTDTVMNSGTFDAGASVTRYFLSLNGTQAAPGTFRLGERAVGALAMGASDSGGATVSIRAGTAAGTYFLLACADHTKLIEETSEINNCLASTGQVVVGGPDLTEQDVMISPQSMDAATGTLSITETVVNASTIDAGPSVTRYYLSADNIFDGDDAFVRNCVNGGPVPGRNVPAIPAGGSSTGSTDTTPLCIRDDMGLHPPASGTYFVIACADETQVVPESNETNQCAVSPTPLTITVCGDSIVEGAETCDDGNASGGDGCSATCQVETSDLAETAVSDPPVSSTPGSSFNVTDTVQNLGGIDVTASTTTRFYLSPDTKLSGGDVFLAGSRAVPPLNAGATSTGMTTVTLPAGVGSGNYYLLACADADNAVAESDEINNCIASTAQTQVGGADLAVTAVDAPPATAAVGSSFTVGDTTSNVGGVDVIATRTKYYLSANGVNAASGTFLLAARDVPALPVGTSSTGTTTATIRLGTAPGTYRILACADRGPGTGPKPQVPETNENNNCFATTMTVVVTP